MASSDIRALSMESVSKESCRKDCSQKRDKQMDLTHRGVTCKAAKSKTKLEIRYINSAIYTEPVSEEERDEAAKIPSSEKNDREDCCKTYVNGGDSKAWVIDVADVTKDGTNEPTVTGQNTYRCYSTILPDATLSPEPSTARSVLSSGTTARVERRCKIGSILEDACQKQEEALRRERYIEDNRQVVRISTTSLSDCEMLSEPDLARRFAHSEWVRRKHEAAQRKREDEKRAMKKREEEEEKMVRKKEERARLEKQNFLKWMEEKQRQELDKKAMFQNELELQKQLKELEDKVTVTKVLCLRQWTRKKKEEQKVRHKEQESRERKVNEEREKRLEQCSKAYERWRQKSKNKPKPATQGLLPHQKAKPAYVNPIPWQPIVEIESDEAQEDTFNDKNSDARR